MDQSARSLRLATGGGLRRGHHVQDLRETGRYETAQSAKRLTALPGDFLHVDSGTFIEIDEHQHFTTYRLATLNLIPMTYRSGSTSMNTANFAALGRREQIATGQPKTLSASAKADGNVSARTTMPFGTW